MSGIEGENPTRRYKWFRPRQAMTGHIFNAGGVNYPTFGLFNNSAYSHYLIVRDFAFVTGGNAGSSEGFYYGQGQPGTLGGNVGPMVPGSAALPGQLFFWDQPTQPTVIFGWYPEVNYWRHWTHEFPMGVVPPGWYIGFVAPDKFDGVTLILNIMWEAILPEELDYIYSF